MRNDKYCSWKNIHTDKNQRFYGTTISIFYKIGEKIVAVLHIDGAIAINLLFCYFKTLNLSNEKWEIL